MRTIAIIICFACIAVIADDGDIKDVLDKVEKGTDAAKELIDVMSTATETLGVLSKFSKFGGPVGIFLGSIGPVLSIISIFLPERPSEELLFMKEKFAEMDAKFDQVFNRFGDVENLIREKALKGQYGEYEQNIVALSDKLQMYLSAPQNAAESMKRQFIRNYESYYDSSALKLYNGIIKGHALSDDIPGTVMQYTKYDRKMFRKIMTSLLNVIVQGVKVQIAYLNMKGENDTYNRIDWEQKLNHLGTSMDEWDIEVKNKWHTQAEKEIDEKLAEYEGSSNSKVAENLYSFLVDKYYWRDWHVLAYKDIKGYKKHMVKVCPETGYRRFRKHGRNLMVGSVDSNATVFDMDSIRDELNRVKTNKKCSKWQFWCKVKNYKAEEIYNRYLPAKFRYTCKYASTGVIDTKNNDVHHRAKTIRLVKTSDRMQIYIFGSGY